MKQKTEKKRKMVIPKRVTIKEDDYYTEKNNFLSNSKLNDFFKDPHYFYQKWIEHSIPIENKKTDALIIGSAVDTYLTEGKEAFLKKYTAVARRNLKNAPTDTIELTEDQYNRALHMAEKVAAQPAYQEIKKQKYKAQEILAVEMNLGKAFRGICGKPDWYYIFPNKTCIIRDLKTTTDIDPDKFYYHCLDYGYFRQQAFYQILLEKIHYMKGLTFKSQILAVEKDPDGIHLCATYTLSQKIIEQEKEKINTILTDLRRDRERYTPKKVTWGMAKKIPTFEPTTPEEEYSPPPEKIDEIIGQL